MKAILVSVVALICCLKLQQCFGTSSGLFTCELRDEGRRVHEPWPSMYDCTDTKGNNTCRGGQCVALVKCSCTRQSNGLHVPSTRCWRPGAALKKNGVCNRDIPPNTAIATFSGNVYTGVHAAIFVQCVNDRIYTIYDQACYRSIGSRNLTSDGGLFHSFHVITYYGGCDEYTRYPCRWEDSGPTECSSYGHVAPKTG